LFIDSLVLLAVKHTGLLSSSCSTVELGNNGFFFLLALLLSNIQFAKFFSIISMIILYSDMTYGNTNLTQT
jgi:hypothetical protein